MAEAGVSKGNLYNYMQIKDSGNPELIDRVKKGELKIGTAHRMLPKEILRQLRQADKMYTYIAKTMPLLDNHEAKQDINNRLLGLSNQLQALLTKYEERKIPC